MANSHEYMVASLLFMSGFHSGITTLVKNRMARAGRTVFFLSVTGVAVLSTKLLSGGICASGSSEQDEIQKNGG